VSFISWASRVPTWLHAVIVGGLLLLTVPVGWASIALSPPESPVAAWWPAASLTVVAATLSRSRRRLILALAVVAVGFAANLAAGRPASVSLGFAVANAAEALVVAAIATNAGREVSIDRSADATRLLIGVIAGALAAGAIVAAVVPLEGGDPLTSGVATAASHGSAVLLLAPFAILPRASYRTDRGWELLAQLSVLVVVAGFVFAPQQLLPIGFLVFPLFVWGTFRFGTGIMAIESLVTAAIATVALYWNAGPFATPGEPAVGVHLVQLFVVVLATTSLVLGRARAERLRIGALSRAREAVLLSGITGTTVGFVILERESGAQLRLAAANDVADELLHAGGAEWQAGDPVELEQFPAALVAPLTELIAGRQISWNGLISAAAKERIVEANLTRVRSARGTVVLTVQVEDVTLREEARLANERALENERATVEQLRETNRQQDAFVSAVSHELRTPLTSIIGFADELSQLDLPAEANTYLEVVTRNAERLGELVEDLLEVGRLNSQVQLKARERLDIDAVIDTVVDDLRLAAAARSVTIERVGVTGSTLHSVRTDVTRILVNLLSNAIKFSPVGGRVEIAVDVSAVHLQIRVADDGPGIAPADLDRVFERFYRASSAATVPGSGLGLVIARGLAENLGGTVRLRSTEGIGTTALLTLPRKFDPQD
jgi:two-component system, OmpR family, phosphate regulon sensor histidine kinase PhoR